MGRALAIAVGLALLLSSGAASARPSGRHCPAIGKPAVAADPRPGALRVFGIQFFEHPLTMVRAGDFRRAVDCVMRLEVVPWLARGRPNVVVFDEDAGIETLAIGSPGASARALLRKGVPACAGQPFPCQTLAVLNALDNGYSRALAYLQKRFPALGGKIGRSFVAGTDTFVRVFMTTMAMEARRYGVYIVASNTQPRFRLTHNAAAVAALRDPAAKNVHAVYAPTSGRAYDQTFIWSPRVLHPRAPAPLANLLARNLKVPLTSTELALGFTAGPARGRAAVANLRPVAIPGTGARLGFATSLPAFVYGKASPAHACDDVSKTYMRCLDHLGANVVIQADANNGKWTGNDGNEQWQPLSWMGSAYRAVSDPTVSFSYAVNPFLVGNLADTPFDGQSAILERGRRGRGCHYVGNGRFIRGQDLAQFMRYAGARPQFLALAPWVVGDRPRSAMRPIGDALAAGTGSYRYVATAVIADLPFPVDRSRVGCVLAGR